LENSHSKALNISILIRRKISKMVGVEFRRRLYKRGSSFETTVPMPLLFALEKNKKYNVVFSFDGVVNRWYLKFEERGGKNEV